MTLRVTLPRHEIVEGPLHGEASAPASSNLGGVVPIGWHPNPLISGEAAAMCQTDYKSAPCRRRNKHASSSSVVRMLLRGAGGNASGEI